MKSIPYGRQYITPEDIDAVVTTLQSDFLTQGPRIVEFETKFAKYVGSNYAVAVSNGTTALHLCALALEVNEASTVITTPITFAASANCVKYCGGNIEFVDIDPETALMDLDKLYALLQKAPKGKYSGVIPVDFAGYPIDLERLRAIADEFDLWIIEDACHAPGGYFTNEEGEQQFCGNGNYADLAIFSFHPVKHIATGEGGMITTNNENLYRKLLLLRTHGIAREPELMLENHGAWYYEMLELGYNYRLCDMQAALGTSQLNRAKEGLDRRKELAARYDRAFEKTAINTIHSPAEIGHAYHLYIIQVEDRKALYEYLRLNNIFAQVHYIPLHLMPYYKNLGWEKGDFPMAEKYYDHCLSIPMFPSLTDEEQDFVIEKILSFLNEYKAVSFKIQ
jgi:UDP-4-amino-4,6-dideoxy-N-acetyl-beta-L-altrosamine transaminase